MTPFKERFGSYNEETHKYVISRITVSPINSLPLLRKLPGTLIISAIVDRIGYKRAIALSASHQAYQHESMMPQDVQFSLQFNSSAHQSSRCPIHRALVPGIHCRLLVENSKLNLDIASHQCGPNFAGCSDLSEYNYPSGILCGIHSALALVPSLQE